MKNKDAAPPYWLFEDFHNPYTFIPIAEQSPRRSVPTPLTKDEKETDRVTGVLDLEVELRSPLLTSNPMEVKDENGHNTHQALTIGPDVILPATGVRGALRSLMTILTNGTLSYLDEKAWLCQGRDVNLGPPPKEDAPPPWLAKIIEPGGFQKDGCIQLGQTRLVKASILADSYRKLPRPESGKAIKHLWTNKEGTSVVEDPDEKHQWQVKLSGEPIGKVPGKREGIFLDDGKIIKLSARFWAAYAGQNRHGDHPELKKDDLVWIEAQPNCQNINSDRDIKSIQWARLGRFGERLLDVIAKHHENHLPDSFNPDGKVDEVTDLFGQVPRKDLTREVKQWANWNKSEQLPGPAGPFAARIRCGNLVFQDATSKLEKGIRLAPLAQPHPGCAGFYRFAEYGDPGDVADHIGNMNLPMRGFKVYRTTKERGADAPWHYDVQGGYDDEGKLDIKPQKLSKYIDLLPEDCGIKGRLRITIRAMTQREICLLLSACTVDWRLGGGKPLGLGHCRVTAATLCKFLDNGSMEEAGRFTRASDEPGQLPEPYNSELKADAQLNGRVAVWQATQQPVVKLRYPRAVDENNNKKNRGGHVWFSRHASPRTPGENNGLKFLHLHGNGELRTVAKNAEAIRAQPLPLFFPDMAQNDVLYGYDLISMDSPDWREKRGTTIYHKKLEPFDPDRHARSSDASGGHQGQNEETRRQQRRNR